MEYILHLIFTNILWYTKATEHCVYPHAQLQQSWAHCDQLHEHHNAHWREHCVVLSTLRTVFRCIALCVFISIHGHRHAHLFLSVLLFLVSLYFVLKSFFHLFLNSAMVPDENSMENPLCNSSFGSMVSLDYVTPDTLIPCHWEIVQALSTLHRLQPEAGEEPHVPTYSHKHEQWHRVHLLHVGIGKVPRGLLKNSESQEGGEPSLEWTERSVTYSILARTFENGFHKFNCLLQMDRFQLTLVYCNRRAV